MRKFFYTLFAILAFVACSDSGPENGGGGGGGQETPKQPEITLSTAAADFSTDGGSNVITFTSSEAWTAEIVNTRADDWCSIEPTSGPAGSAKITVTTTANDTPDDRTASIIIKAGTASKTINVSQKQKDALTVTSSKFEISAEGGEVSIEVKANIDFEYTLEDGAEEWIEYKSTRAMTTSHLVFEVKKNDDTEKREAKIAITSGEFSEVVTIYQAGAEPSIILTENEFTVSSSAETVAVEVKSNVDVTVELPSDADWITENTTRAFSTNTYYFDIAQNDGYDNRTAQIKFTNKETGIYEYVTVTQMQRDAIVVADSEYELGTEGGKLDFEIQTNVDITVTISDNAKSWITQVETRALETKALHFDIAACTDGNAREGVITIIGGTATQKITIKQSAIEIDAESVPADEIWYRTSDGQLFDIYAGAEFYNLVQPFDRNVISHTYQNGKGVIKFDGAVTIINDFTFHLDGARLIDIYLPDDIEFLGAGAIYNTSITTIRIPKNLKQVNNYGLENEYLETFTGHNISEDGKCVIVDGVLLAFADKGVIDYTLPSNVKSTTQFCIYQCKDLETLNLNEGLEELGYWSISNCPKLKRVTFPSTLQTASTYNFKDCNNMEGFYGNEKFHTPDNRCHISYIDPTESGRPESWKGYWIHKFAGAGLTEYTIPEGIVGIGNYAFDSNDDIRSVTLAESLVEVSAEAFHNCSNLEALYGPHTSSDHRCTVFDGELRAMVVYKNLPVDYRIPDDVIGIGYGAFQYNDQLVNVTMGDQITYIGGYAFANCPNLKSVTLSGALTKIGCGNYDGHNPFFRSYNLESIYFRSYIPPLYIDPQMSEFSKLKVYVPEQAYDLYKRDVGWIKFNEYMTPYECKDMFMPDYYVSTDFSKNGEVTLLQKASEGNGIDLVLMGDVYSDRQIESGLYRQDMELAADAFFAIEPYKSFRHLFNVYMVTAVSAIETRGLGTTAFATQSSGRAEMGYDPLVIEYAEKAVGASRMDDVMAVVLINAPGGGTCFYDTPDTENDWGSGLSLSYFSIGDRGENLENLIQHETGGHGFAKLSDEYVMNMMGHVSAMDVIKHNEESAKYGWWKNTDFTNDPTKVKWSHFLNDARYADEGLGVFEGGLVYPYGVWRSSEDSIMNSGRGGFNAPSREAIYYRIHKLAYGPDWKYDYEEFVKWDAINRNK